MLGPAPNPQRGGWLERLPWGSDSTAGTWGKEEPGGQRGTEGEKVLG